MSAVKWLSTPQQKQAAVISNPEVSPLIPSPKEVTTPAITVSITPARAYLSSESLKKSTPSSAVATNSMLSQMETEAALAVCNPASSNSGPMNPPKKMIPIMFNLLLEWNSMPKPLFLLKMEGSMAIPAPR
jgi:hypothetical protein